MNKKVLATAILAAFAGAAHAQSSVSLYGVIDAGISYVNNSKTSTGHDNLVKFDDGVAQGSRWGMKGAEDLGGGLKAIFTLESGFNVGTGAMGQSSTLFGRQAFVGVSQNGVGSFTMGRQYSFSTDFLGGAYSTGGNTVAGNYAYHINDVDQLTSSRINNSVKFTSANFSGLTFGALYGFSNAAGAFGGAPVTGTTASPVAGSSRAYSFGLNYANGPFAVGAAYTDIKYPGQISPQSMSTNLANVTFANTAPGSAAGTSQIRDLRTFGVGGRYNIAAATLWALFTDTRLEPQGGSSTTFTAYEAGGKYAFTSALTAGLGYTYMHMSGFNTGHWNQVDASVDYALSKRTDVYVLGVYQGAAGNNRGTELQAQIGSSTSYFNTSGAGSDSQVAFRVGLRHKF
ncbi:porin [Paraburkholderia sp.]|uniref:porin n=1 Tax=Paraburkholderia sp. TaxID=1926495 RepID=UPI0023951643|nr:porin [Paraburkholderia sp.]MDE1179709.1 porin [Paraburkholderia sp.]